MSALCAVLAIVSLLTMAYVGTDPDSNLVAHFMLLSALGTVIWWAMAAINMPPTILVKLVTAITIGFLLAIIVAWAWVVVGTALTGV
jgi:uncharacterized membrane protein YwzB